MDFDTPAAFCRPAGPPAAGGPRLPGAPRPAAAGHATDDHDAWPPVSWLRAR